MKKLMALVVAVFLSCPALSLAGTTVKSGKSNADNRVGPTGGTANEGGSANRATTVKGSKSNSDNRVGPTGESTNQGGTADRATSVKSSKSNGSD